VGVVIDSALAIQNWSDYSQAYYLKRMGIYERKKNSTPPSKTRVKVDFSISPGSGQMA
jgi:hypothetical protein